LEGVTTAFNLSGKQDVMLQTLVGTGLELSVDHWLLSGSCIVVDS
jgi:hypothetical protein